MQTNSFEEGMNKSISKDRLKPTSYRDARNFRLSDDGEDSGGALANVKGNTLELTIPTSPSVFKVSPIVGVAAPIAGVTDNFTVETAAGVITEAFQLISGGFEDYFNQVMDVANDPTSALSIMGIKVVRTSANSVSVYSENAAILSVNSLGQSNYTIGTQFATRQTDLQIIGYTEIRDQLIICTTNDTSKKGGNGQVWVATYDKVFDTYSIEIRYTHDDIGFSTEHPIEMVARYENEEIQRTYFTDNHNNVRALNVASISTSLGVDPAFLSLTPSIDFSRPVLNSINSGGTLKAGIYQYAYRLSSSTGAQSKVSPASRLINVLLNSESGTEWSQLGEYSGTNPSTVTTKSVSVSIKDIDSTYDTIELISLYYGAAESTPEINVFESLEIPSSNSIVITHTGEESSFSLSDTEYKIFGVPFEKAKTLSYKDNRLIVGNISAPKNDTLKFHARAYRFGNSLVDNNISGNPAYNNGNSYSVTGELSSIKSYVPGLNTADADWGYEDPEDVSVSSVVRDAINPYNKVDWNSNFLPFKWQTDGVTLGGEGPYVKYKFITQSEITGANTEGYFYDPANMMNSDAPLLESRKQSTVYEFGTNDEKYPVISTPLNHKSPFVNVIFRGYSPGEVYRFGIVLYDLAGNPGFVNWIGDIKFPERWEMRRNLRAYGNYHWGETIAGGPYVGGADMLKSVSDSLGDRVELNQLGLEFDIEIPANLLDSISGYEIVRVKREVSDRTKLAQGIAHQLCQVESDDNLYLFPRKGGNLLRWNVSGPMVEGRKDAYPDYDDLTLYPADAKKSLVIYSPELQFFNTVGSSLGDRIRVDGTFTEIIEEDLTINNTMLNCGVSEPTKIVIHPGTENGYGDPTDGDQVRSNGKKTIPLEFTREIQPGAVLSAIPTLSPTVQFTNSTPPTADMSNSEEQVDGGLCLFVTLGGGVELFLPGNTSTQSGGLNGRPMLVTYERELLDQYGGNTQAARANNVYQSTGGFIQKESGSSALNTFSVFGGDVYHAQYDFTRVDGKEPIDPVTYTSRDGVVVPLVSTFNTTLRNGRHFLNKAKPDGSYPPASDITYAHDTYEAESLYSREDDFISFIGRPVGVPLLETFDNRIYASRGKINGEVIDNWRQFDAFLYKDVEGSLGPVNRLINHNDMIFFFQDHGCGYLLINPRGSITGGPAGSLQIGFGDVLHDFEYISTDIGCFHQWVPISTNTNLMFIDSYHKQMYSIKGKQLVPVSMQAGMNPWFFDKLVGNLLTNDNPLINKGIHSTWSTRFNEVWFTFLNRQPISLCKASARYTFQAFPSDNIMTNALKVSKTCLGILSISIGNYVEINVEGVDQSILISETTSDTDFVYIRMSVGSFIGSDAIFNGAVDATGIIDQDLYGKYLGETALLFDVQIMEIVEETIVYNEAYEVFTGFYDHAPTIYLNDGVNILSPNPINSEALYRHNKGKYGEFYGNIFNSTLQLIINDGKGITKVFDNFGYYTEVFSNDSNPIQIDQETFSRIRCNTTYQNTDWVSIVPKNNIRRVDREWQSAIARNAVLNSFGATPVDIDIFNPVNLDKNREFKDRLRDKIMIADFEFDNINDRRFLLHYLKTFYRFSAR